MGIGTQILHSTPYAIKKVFSEKILLDFSQSELGYLPCLELFSSLSS